MEKLEQNPRINVSISTKKNGFNYSCSLSKDVPSGVGEYDYINKITDELYDYVNGKFADLVTNEEISGRQFKEFNNNPTQTSATISAFQNNVISPKCPQCGAEMRQRSGRKGSFWGCSNYPRCRGTREV